MYQSIPSNPKQQKAQEILLPYTRYGEPPFPALRPPDTAVRLRDKGLGPEAALDTSDGECRKCGRGEVKEEAGVVGQAEDTSYEPGETC